MKIVGEWLIRSAWWCVVYIAASVVILILIANERTSTTTGPPFGPRHSCHPPVAEPPSPHPVKVCGLRSDVMVYHASQQQEENWCWATCIEMVLSAKHVKVSQQEIVQNVFGQIVDRPGSALDILAGFDGVAETIDGNTVRLKPKVEAGVPSFETLKRYLDQQTPVIVAITNPNSPIGHVIVITAVIYEIRDGRPQILRLQARDPAPSASTTGGKRTVQIDEFLRVSFYVVVDPLESR